MSGLLGPDGRLIEPRKLAGGDDEGWALSTTIPNMHDTEIVECERVLEVLSTRSGRYTDLEGYRVEIIDRFRDIGFVVDVKVFSTNVENVWWFDMDLTRRLREFDPDRQVWEVTNDVLEFGEKGVIKTDSGMMKDLMDGAPEMPKPKG